MRDSVYMTNQGMTMKFEEYVESQEWVVQTMYQMHMEGGVDLDQLFDSVRDQAASEGVTLIDLETVPFEDVLADIYNEIDFG